MQGRFARLPLDIMQHRALSAADKLVYAALAVCVRKTNIATVGQRKLAQLAGVGRATVQRSLLTLGRHGLISCSIHRLGNRMVYQLNHPLFLDLHMSSTGPQDESTSGIRMSPRIDNRSKKPTIQ